MNNASQKIAIVGSTGTIGSAMLEHLASKNPSSEIFSFSRQELSTSHTNVQHYRIDGYDEQSIAQAAESHKGDKPWDMILVTTGILHDQKVQPEKALRDICQENFEHIFAANLITPSLVAKHFLKNISRQDRSIFAALSARVGSISDNRLGGWYAYRASKAALNMMIKNISIEYSRRYKEAIIVGLHPGTVDSPLSEPFQKHIPEHKLFKASFAAEKLLDVLSSLTAANTGQCLAWDGQEISP